MKVLIDFSQLPISKVGVGVYGLNLVRNLSFTKDFIIYVLIQDDDDSLDSIESLAIILVRVDSNRFRKLFHRFYLEQIYIPYLVFKLDIDIVHSLHYSFPIMHSAKKVVTMCDMIFFKYPELHLRRKVLYFRFFIWLSTFIANKVICISKSTEQDYLKHFRVAPKLTTVIELGKDESYTPNIERERVDLVLRKYNITMDYILFIGTIEPRKNIVNLIFSFAKLVATGCHLHLVIVGKKGWHYDEVFSLVIKLRLEDKIIFTGFVDEDEKPPILVGAKIFVYPSIYEGFGIPVLESLACGTPTITSNISSMPEVAGNAAVLINPLNVDEIYLAMKNLLNDKELCDELRARGLKQSSRFNWRLTAERTVITYRSVLELND